VSVSALVTPLAAFAESTTYTGPVLIMAWEQTTDESDCALCVDDEGGLRSLSITTLRVDVRYDWNQHKWIDVNGVTDDAEEEPSPDGGAEVPG
jgi:hypothetical protein